MSTKALRKELFAAVAMLIVAAIALSGSTYAWFAANTTVTAEDMKVTVVSDQAFLLIGNVNDGDAIRTAKSTTAGATTTNVALKPAAHNAVATSGAADTYGNWYFNYSKDPGASTSAGVGTPEALSVDNFDKYVLVNTFYLTVAAGSNAVHQIQATNCGIATTTDQAVKVLVATSEGYQEFSGDGSVRTGDEYIYNSNITENDVVPVKVYVYWDGEDFDVFTNNREDLGPTSVTVQFKGEIVPQPAS